MNKVNSQKKKILIIEDNPGILFAMEQAFSMSGYDVETATNFKGALHVSKTPPDLIFLDVFLESQDGRVITKELKAHKGTKNIPVVILSAYPGIAELAKEAGADNSLAKPFELSELLAITKKYIA